jgi:GAF domain-containing protein
MTDADDEPGTSGEERDAEDGSALLAVAALARRLAVAPHSELGGGWPVLEAVAAAAVAILDAEAASIALHDPATGRLTFVAAAGPQGAGVVGLSIDAGAGIAGYALTTGQALAVADVATDARFDRSTAAQTGYVPHSILAVPLTDERGTIGVLEVLDRHGERGFDLRDLDIATALAVPATAAVRAGALERDGATLVRGVLREVAGGSLTPDEVDRLVIAVSEGIDRQDDGARWRLADRIARLRDADPTSVELAIEWLDVLLRHAPERRR